MAKKVHIIEKSGEKVSHTVKKAEDLKGRWSGPPAGIKQGVEFLNQRYGKKTRKSEGSD